MDAKNALYFCGGVALGVAGALSFLWFWEEREMTAENDIPKKQVTSEVTEHVPKTVDRSTLDGTSFDSAQRIEYNRVVDYLYNKDAADPQDSSEHIRRINDADFQALAADGNYDTKSLTLYSDGILADSISDEVMSESDAFTALGPNYTIRKLQRIFTQGAKEFLEGMLIRNDRLYTLYEITYDVSTYKEVTGGD